MQKTNAQEDLKTHSVRIYGCLGPDAVGIIIEGIPVLKSLDNLARGCCLLLRVTYALNLKYPARLKLNKCCKTIPLLCLINLYQ